MLCFFLTVKSIEAMGATERNPPIARVPIRGVAEECVSHSPNVAPNVPRLFFIGHTVGGHHHVHAGLLRPRLRVRVVAARGARRAQPRDRLRHLRLLPVLVRLSPGAHVGAGVHNGTARHKHLLCKSKFIHTHQRTHTRALTNEVGFSSEQDFSSNDEVTQRCLFEA